MVTPDNELIITIVAGSGLLISLAIVLIIAAARYQARKQRHLADLRHMKLETEQLILKTKFEVQEKALTDISREIHDNIGQLLAVVKMNLHALKPADSLSQTKLATSSELIARVISEVRNLSKLLSADYISQQALTDMMAREVDYIQRSGLLDIQLTVAGEEPTIPATRKLVLFRIGQECIQNALKHAQAQHIYVNLTFSEDDIQMKIKDDGIGFNPKAVEAGNGLHNLHARAKAIGGTLDILSKPRSGCLVEVSIPNTSEGSFSF